MPFLRFTLDLAIKEPIPQALKDKLPEIKTAIKKLKSFASNINAGQINEEMTIRVSYHTCNHDINAPCGEETEI